mgnify:CR=1 FL=1
MALTAKLAARGQLMFGGTCFCGMKRPCRTVTISGYWPYRPGTKNSSRTKLHKQEAGDGRFSAAPMPAEGPRWLIRRRGPAVALG